MRQEMGLSATNNLENTLLWLSMCYVTVWRRPLPCTAWIIYYLQKNMHYGNSFSLRSDHAS